MGSRLLTALSKYLISDVVGLVFALFGYEYPSLTTASIVLAVCISAQLFHVLQYIYLILLPCSTRMCCTMVHSNVGYGASRKYTDTSNASDVCQENVDRYPVLLKALKYLPCVSCILIANPLMYINNPSILELIMIFMPYVINTTHAIKYVSNIDIYNSMFYFEYPINHDCSMGKHNITYNKYKDSSFEDILSMLASDAVDELREQEKQREKWRNSNKNTNHTDGRSIKFI